MTKEKLLYISPQCPYPAIDGGKISIYYPVIYLSRYFRIYLVFPSDNNPEIKKAKEHFESLGIYTHIIDKQITGKFIDFRFLVLNIGNSIPFKWQKYYCKRGQSQINKLVFENNIRYVFVSSPHMMKYAMEIKRVKPDVIVFFREHNIEYALVEQFKDLTRNPILRLIAKWQLKKSKFQEVNYWKAADRVFFISDYDYSIAAHLAGEIKYKFKILYDGFGVNFNDTNNVKNSDFIYTANLKTIQNDLSFKWFIEKIWLPNLKVFKSLNLHLNVSGNDTELLKSKLKGFGNLENLNIKSIGFVHDIDGEIRKYKYVLSPTTMGSGIRLKILNGMACGKPVFITPLDLKTCNVFIDMYNVVCFENAKSFIDKFLFLQNKPNIYKSICQNAINTIINYFSWQKYAKTIYNEYINF